MFMQALTAGMKAAISVIMRTDIVPVSVGVRSSLTI